MKTEVYSWRLSARKKAELDSEARREGKSIAGLLDEITTDWLEARRDSRNGDEAEQVAIRKRAAKVIGSLRGGNPDRSSQASQRVWET
jgi:hypothetical protein